MEIKINQPFWSLLKFEDWHFYILCYLQGLVFVGSQNKPIEEMFEWAKKRFPGSPFVEDEEKLEPYVNEIIQYLAGKRQTFTIPFEYVGTPFQLAVWQALCEIPYGQTKSYSDIAHAINKPAAVRAVGRLLVLIQCCSLYRAIV